MTLSPLAAHIAAEINAHDWSDAPFRFDRAGHRREHDTKKSTHSHQVKETQYIQANVAMVAAQVLGYIEGESFDPHQFVLEAGVASDFRLNKGRRSGGIDAALRKTDGVYDTPGSTLVYLNHYVESIEDATIGLIRTTASSPLEETLPARATVNVVFNGMIYGRGIVQSVETRGDWKVVIWDRYKTYRQPYPKC